MQTMSIPTISRFAGFFALFYLVPNSVQADEKTLKCPAGCTSKVKESRTEEGAKLVHEWCADKKTNKKHGPWIKYRLSPDLLDKDLSEKKVSKFSGRYFEGLPDGKWTCFDDNGKPEQEFTISVGTGKFSKWNIGCIAEAEGHLKKGSREGLWTFYDAVGNKLKEVTFKDDKENGTANIFCPSDGTKMPLLNKVWVKTLSISAPARATGRCSRA